MRKRSSRETTRRKRNAALARLRTQGNLKDPAHKENGEERWQIADLMPQLVWSAHPDGKVVYCNQRHHEFEGFSKRPDGFWNWEGALHPDDVNMTVSRWKEALKSAQTYQAEHRLRKAGGDYGWYLSRAVPVREADNRIVRWFGTATDINDLKKAEEAKRESESQYRAFFDNAAVGMVEMDLSGRFLRTNEKFCEISGFTCEEILRIDMAELTHPDDRETDREIFRRFQQNLTSSYEIEKRYLRKDGQVAWIQVSAGMIQAEGERPQRLAAVVRDITLQKQAEAALREREKRFRSALERAAIGVAYVEPNTGRWLWVNRKFSEVLGYPPEEFLATTEQEISHPEDREASIAESKRLQCGDLDTFTTEKRYLHRNGAMIWVRVTVSAVRDEIGASKFNVEIAEDITRRKAIEQALETTENRLKMALEASRIGTWELDLVHGKAWRTLLHDQIFGYSSLLPEWNYDRFLDHVVAEDREEVDRRFKDAYADKKPWNVECRIRKADGEIRWIWVQGKFHYDSQAKPLRIYGLVADITERKSMEQNLRLAQRVAEEASRAKSEFLANLSHEIRTPMTVFLAALEFLRQQDQSPEHNELLDMAEKSAHRLRSLIEDILDFSRIEARRVEIHEDPFCLRECVQTATELLKGSVEKDVHLSVEIADEVPELVTGDADRLSQVLINLIGNAIKFTKQGEVKIVVGTEGEGLIFSVIDTGPGIPSEKQAILFESFTQVDSSNTRRYGGTGLGLAISKGLVELMGGNIWVRSRPGAGSIFSFILPLKVPAQGVGVPVDEPAHDMEPAGEWNARILIAEDEPMVREMIRIILEQRGYRVESAETGKDAITRWKQGDYDLILMDMQMPEVDGVEATRTIRRIERETGRDYTCIIALTAHARREVQEECLAAGMDTYLTKPISNKALFAAMDNCLSR